MVSNDLPVGGGQPPTRLIVETRSLMSNDPRRFVETYDVQRPIGIMRQRDQIVRAVTSKHSSAELASIQDGIATFFTRTEMIVASYEDASRLQADSALGQAQAFDIPL
ncbi:MAG: hypothetical protein WDZ37_04975 [Solirubrobacterales bacterium]